MRREEARSDRDVDRMQPASCTLSVTCNHTFQARAGKMKLANRMLQPDVRKGLIRY